MMREGSWAAAGEAMGSILALSRGGRPRPSSLTRQSSTLPLMIAVGIISLSAPTPVICHGAVGMTSGSLNPLFGELGRPLATSGMRSLLSFAHNVANTFEKNRQRASKRWEVRSEDLPAPYEAIFGLASHAISELIPREVTAAVESNAKTNTEKEERIAREMGLSDFQFRHMISHYRTLRPSNTRLKEPVATDSSHVDEDEVPEEEHVLAPTHKDEVDIAMRRDTLRQARRFRMHSQLKSHVS